MSDNLQIVADSDGGLLWLLNDNLKIVGHHYFPALRDKNENSAKSKGCSVVINS
jgi:hypothetical protein